MRATLDLPEDVYRVAKSLAGHKRISLGAAVVELARHGLPAATGIDRSKAFCFALPLDTPPISLERTLLVEDEP